MGVGSNPTSDKYFSSSIMKCTQLDNKSFVRDILCIRRFSLTDNIPYIAPLELEKKMKLFRQESYITENLVYSPYTFLSDCIFSLLIKDVFQSSMAN